MRAYRAVAATATAFAAVGLCAPLAAAGGSPSGGPRNVRVSPSSVHQGGILTISVDGCERGGTVRSNAFPDAHLSRDFDVRRDGLGNLVNRGNLGSRSDSKGRGNLADRGSFNDAGIVDDGGVILDDRGILGDRGFDPRGNFNNRGNLGNRGFDDRGNFNNRGNFNDRRDDRGNFNDRGNLGNRGDFNDRRDDRGNFNDRGNLGNRGDFNDRRDDRGNFDDRGNLGNRGNFDDRGNLGNRGNFDDRGNLGNRGNFDDRGNLGVRGEFDDRDLRDGRAVAFARVRDNATPGRYNLTVRCDGSPAVASAQFTVLRGRGAQGGLGGSIGPSSAEMGVGAGLVATAAVGGSLFIVRRRRIGGQG
ncbi:hypothetical protein [Streptomyces sp. NPDC058572]|uniref:hypothetical protein n=1 Tax=Streptomyces sp. NPDC058572 TaxID=3346546 RepID=UPI003654BCD5